MIERVHAHGGVDHLAEDVAAELWRSIWRTLCGKRMEDVYRVPRPERATSPMCGTCRKSVLALIGEPLSSGRSAQP